jgi:hypothetical protein
MPHFLEQNFGLVVALAQLIHGRDCLRCVLHNEQ